MRIINDLKQLSLAATELGRDSGLGGVLVPTMGALHEGHALLIRRGTALAEERQFGSGCVVSIFVNPTQFNDASDLARYPRTLEADLEICSASGAAAVFAPDVPTMYPPPPSLPIEVPPLPAVAITPGLEDAHRPGHFAGVCQVVRRLFDLLKPEAALFGEKDWQQLQVIRAMTVQSGMPVDIVPCPTVREADGLAMSSRNRFLSPQERSAAAAISQALRLAQAEDRPEPAERIMRRVLTDGGLDVEYSVIRDAATLGPVITGHQARALIAARAGGTRLIDNAPWPAGAGSL
jgi:pantoate--beta-alanine ligase